MAIFSLTDDQLRQIKQWERDKDALEREIVERQAKLSDIAEKLKAVAVLRAQPSRQETRAVAATNGHAEPPESEGSSLTAAIEQIATTSSAPLTKKQLKEKLLEQHFSEDRMGPYFYTCLMRLKKKERIRVLDDGRVWKP
jgi:hypothetical protein